MKTGGGQRGNYPQGKGNELEEYVQGEMCLYCGSV